MELIRVFHHLPYTAVIYYILHLQPFTFRHVGLAVSFGFNMFCSKNIYRFSKTITRIPNYWKAAPNFKSFLVLYIFCSLTNRSNFVREYRLCFVHLCYYQQSKKRDHIKEKFVYISFFQYNGMSIHINLVLVICSWYCIISSSVAYFHKKTKRYCIKKVFLWVCQMQVFGVNRLW